MNEFDNPIEPDGPDDDEATQGIPAAWLELGAPVARPTDTLGNATSALPTDPFIALGTPLISGYDLLEEIGRGAGGVVFRAYQHNPARVVAIKMLVGQQLSTDSLVRFRQESDSLARLQHPGIVQVFEVGACNGQPFFSMDYCGGGNLAQRINGTPLPPRDAAVITARLAGAIQKAHEAGIVHRDLKPGNVLISDLGVRNSDSKTGQSIATASTRVSETRNAKPETRKSKFEVVKISDFGLAKHLDSDDSKTRSGAILGTPSYMSPEQANETTSVTPAADIWSLGAVLYEMLTGRPPFKGATILDTLEQVRNRLPVSPSSLNPQTPRDLETICLKCLRKDPHKRYESAAALADDLGRWLDGKPIAARRMNAVEHAWRWCRTRPALAALTAYAIFAAVAVLVGALVYSRRLGIAEGNENAARMEQRSAEELARVASENEAAHRYRLKINAARELLDRRRLGWRTQVIPLLDDAARIDTAARDPVELRSEFASCAAGVDLCRPREVFPEMIAGTTAFSGGEKPLMAVGQQRAIFLSPMAIQVGDPATGEIRHRFFVTAKLIIRGVHTTPDGIQALAFSPDGRWLVAGTRAGAIYRWDLKQPKPEEIAFPVGHTHSVHRLAFDRGGVNLYSIGADGRVLRWDMAAGGKLAGQFAGLGAGEDVAVLPDSRVIASGNDRLFFLDPTTLKPVGEPFLAENAGAFALSSEGSTAGLAKGRQVGIVGLRDAPALVRSLRDPYGDALCETKVNAVCFSPDGALLVTAAHADEDRHLKIWDAANGRLLGSLFVPGYGPIAPNFSPDGNQLAIISDRKTLLYQVIRSSVVDEVALSARPVRAFDWSPDSNELAIVIGDDSGRGRFAVHGVGDGMKRQYPIQRGPTTASVAWAKSGTLAWTGEGGRLTMPDPGNASRLLHSKEAAPRVLVFDGRGDLWGVAGDQIRQWPIEKDAGEIPPSRFIWQNLLGDLFRAAGEITDIAAGSNNLVFGTRDGAFYLYPFGAKTPVEQWITNFDPLQSVALSLDESLALAGSRSGKLHVFDLAARTHSETVGSSESLDAVAIAPDGKLLATGARDGTIKLWRWNGRAELLLSVSWPTPVRKLRFSPDGTRLAVLHTGECALRVWDIATLRRSLAERGLDW